MQHHLQCLLQLSLTAVIGHIPLEVSAGFSSRIGCSGYPVISTLSCIVVFNFFLLFMHYLFFFFPLVIICKLHLYRIIASFLLTRVATRLIVKGVYPFVNSVHCKFSIFWRVKCYSVFITKQILLLWVSSWTKNPLENAILASIENWEPV